MMPHVTFIRDAVLPGLHLPTLELDTDKAGSRDQLAFRPLLHYLKDVKEGQNVTERDLQSVLTCLETALPIIMLSQWISRACWQPNLSDIIQEFTKYPVPARLITWREEVRDIVTMATGRKSSSTSVGVNITPLQPVEEERDDEPHHVDPEHTVMRDAQCTSGEAVDANPTDSSILCAPSTFQSTYPISRTPKRPSPAVSRSTSKKPKSEASSMVGVRCPDGIIVLQRPGRSDLVLLVLERKTFNILDTSGASLRAHWRQGMGQVILYLVQCHQYCGTRLGAFVLRTFYSRLYIESQIVHIDVGLETIRKLAAATGQHIGDQSLVMTVQELFAASDVLASAMPHSWLDEHDDIDHASLVSFCDFLSLAIGQLGNTPVSDLGDRLPGSEPLVSSPACMLSPSSSLPDKALLELAHQAYPDKYPRWWVDAKAKLVASGTPDAPVHISAKPRSDADQRVGCRGGRYTSHGQGELHDQPPLGARRVEAARSQQDSEPLQDDDDGREHMGRWLAQQSSICPITSPGQPTATSAEYEETGEHAAREAPHTEQHDMSRESLREAALYDPAAINRLVPVSLCTDRISTGHDDDSDLSSSEVAKREQQRLFVRDLARLTLAGWRVRLITPDAMAAKLEGLKTCTSKD